jgi:hypothetical protein
MIKEHTALIIQENSEVIILGALPPNPRPRRRPFHLLPQSSKFKMSFFMPSVLQFDHQEEDLPYSDRKAKGDGCLFYGGSGPQFTFIEAIKYKN